MTRRGEAERGDQCRNINSVRLILPREFDKNIFKGRAVTVQGADGPLLGGREC